MPGLALCEQELLDFVAKIPEQRLLKILPYLSNDELELIAADFAQDGSECGCTPVPLPCECGYVTYGVARLTTCGDRQVGDLRAVHRVNDPRDAVTDGPMVCKVCDMEPDFAPCPHFRNRPQSFAVQTAVNEILSREPPAPSESTQALTQEALAVIRAKRHERGEGLWHDADLVHADMTETDLDRLRRTIYTLSGWKRAGKPDEVQSPPRNGDTVTGELRILAA